MVSKIYRAVLSPKAGIATTIAAAHHFISCRHEQKDIKTSTDLILARLTFDIAGVPGVIFFFSELDVFLDHPPMI